MALSPQQGRPRRALQVVGVPYASLQLGCPLCGGSMPIRSTWCCSACGRTVHQRCGTTLEQAEASAFFVCRRCLPHEPLYGGPDG
jgi:hypothetical protein